MDHVLISVLLRLYALISVQNILLESHEVIRPIQAERD